MTHPLQRLSADEIRAPKRLFTEQGLLTPTTRFARLALEEPPKADVLAFQPGDAVDRRVRAVLLDVATGRSSMIVASLTRGELDEQTAIGPATQGQPPILLEEFTAPSEAGVSRPWAPSP